MLIRFGARTRPAASPPGSDARRRDDDPRRLDTDPELRRRHLLRRRVGRSVLLAIFVAGTVGALFGERGWLDVRRLRRETADLERLIERQRAELAAQRDAVRRLASDPTSRERIARERLGLIDDGEVDFLLPREPDDR